MSFFALYKRIRIVEAGHVFPFSKIGNGLKARDAIIIVMRRNVLLIKQANRELYDMNNIERNGLRFRQVTSFHSKFIRPSIMKKNDNPLA